MHPIDSRAGVEARSAMFLQILKNSTSEAHRLLESNSLLSSLVSPAVSPHIYYCYLVLMKHVVLEYEAEVLKALEVSFPDWQQRRLSVSIGEDLESIGYVPAGVSMPAGYNPSIDKGSMGQLLGFAYVIEGSKLGGRVILKYIRHRLDVSETAGAKFLYGDGVDTSAVWKQFLSRFSGYVVEHGIEEEAVLGAKDAFGSIYRYFELNRPFYEI